jgi:DtxR family Mn-dependent transcriptional regulator
MENRSTEDYIKAIYQLEPDQGRVSTTALALRLGVSNASITGMLKSLSNRDLVRYKRYAGVSLSPAGRRMALRIVRRHRLWEMYLVRFLGYSWDRVHEEAERLEHVTSAELESQLDHVLGYPESDPHGDPIPRVEGTIRRRREKSLAECPLGIHVVVKRISDRNEEILRHASALGLRLQTPLQVKERRKFDGSMLVRVGRKNRQLSKALAEAVFVEVRRAR